MSARVEITAGGAFTERLPATGREGNRARVEIAPGSSLATLLERLGVGSTRPPLVLLNGTAVAPAAWADTTLADGDRLALVPPMRAG